MITLNIILLILTLLVTTLLLLVATTYIGQAKWLRYYIMSSLLTNFVVYDDATRGPWGSTQLLCTSRGTYIASLGALLTILSISIRPTVQ